MQLHLFNKYFSVFFLLDRHAGAHAPYNVCAWLWGDGFSVSDSCKDIPGYTNCPYYPVSVAFTLTSAICGVIKFIQPCKNMLNAGWLHITPVLSQLYFHLPPLSLSIMTKNAPKRQLSKSSTKHRFFCVSTCQSVLGQDIFVPDGEAINLHGAVTAIRVSVWVCEQVNRCGAKHIQPLTIFWLNCCAKIQDPLRVHLSCSSIIR